MPSDWPKERRGGPAHGARRDDESDPTDAWQSRSNGTGSSGSATTAAPLAATELLTVEHQAWLQGQRGIDVEIALRYGVRSAEGRSTGSWVCWTFDNGAVQFRRTDEKAYRWQPGSEMTWWNAGAITDPTLADQPLIITEGVIDALTALSAGYRRVVSVPIGAPSNANGNAKYPFVADSLDALKGCKEIILAVDGDQPGQNLLHDLATRLKRGRCKYLEYPDGCKDLNDVARMHGYPGVTRVVASAKWCHVPGLFRMSELPPVPYAKPHFPMIDGLGEHYRLRKGDFAVITGVPGSGKSTFVNDLCCRMAQHHGWRTCFGSFEQLPQVDHRRALRTWHSRRLERDMDPVQRIEADAWIDDAFSFIVPSEDEDCSLAWLLERMASAVVRYGADICVIDPWNELDHDRPRDMSITEYVGACIRQLKRFAKSWNVHLIVVAHPTKLQKDKATGQTPEPTLYDISDSANWANKCDIGIVVHPCQDDEGLQYTGVRVRKSRYHSEIGTPGLVKLCYLPQQSRFVAAIGGTADHRQDWA